MKHLIDFEKIDFIDGRPMRLHLTADENPDTLALEHWKLSINYALTVTDETMLKWLVTIGTGVIADVIQPAWADTCRDFGFGSDQPIQLDCTLHAGARGGTLTVYSMLFAPIDPTIRNDGV